MEDFICPENFDCPEELMPEVEFWAKIYGEYGEDQIVVYNQTTRKIYSTIHCGKNCENYNPKAEIEKTKNSLGSDQEKEVVKYRTGLKEKFMAGIPMYKKNRDYIVSELIKNGLPTEIQYLPFSESTYNPFAISTAKAVGTWQLMPDVARKNGLIVNSTIDERRDPIKSTDAAIKYLLDATTCLQNAACSSHGEDLYGRALGPFLMTSYIYGIAGMANAIHFEGTNYMNIRKNYQGKAFGSYTRNYYAKFLSAYHVATHEVDYFGGFIEPENVCNTQVLKLSRATKTKPLISTFSFDVNQLKILRKNMRYTDYVWNGYRSIPANYTLELPYTENPKIENYGDIVETYTVHRCDRMQEIKPISTTLLPQEDLQPPLASPRALPVPEPTKKRRNLLGLF
jgi:hypothetical protein